MRRGEIWTAAGGAAYAGKPRPFLIIQDDVYLETESIVLCALTTEQAATRFFRPALEPDSINGLKKSSRVMVDKVAAIPRMRMRERVGRISTEQMRAVENALMTLLGMAR